jgi:hypothetical protein
VHVRFGASVRSAPVTVRVLRANVDCMTTSTSNVPPSEEPTTAPQPITPAPPSPNAGWAVASLLFFWPLSFSAFSHALNVYPLWASGNFAGAQYASDRVRRLGQLSLWIFGGFLLLLAIFYAISIIVIVAQGGMDWDGYGRDYAAA